MQNMLEKLIEESKALERAIAGEDLNTQDGIELMESDDLYMIGSVADATRKKFVGDKVTFTASSYLNYTNVCAASCQICAFYRKENDNDAYTLTPEQIENMDELKKHQELRHKEFFAKFEKDTTS